MKILLISTFIVICCVFRDYQTTDDCFNEYLRITNGLSKLAFDGDLLKAIWNKDEITTIFISRWVVCLLWAFHSILILDLLLYLWLKFPYCCLWILNVDFIFEFVTLLGVFSSEFLMRSFRTFVHKISTPCKLFIQTMRRLLYRWHMLGITRKLLANDWWVVVYEPLIWRNSVCVSNDGKSVIQNFSFTEYPPFLGSFFEFSILFLWFYVFVRFHWMIELNWLCVMYDCVVFYLSHRTCEPIQRNERMIHCWVEFSIVV